MSKVSLTYKEGSIKKQEVVEPSSKRFMELVATGNILQIEVAEDQAVTGQVKFFKDLTYRDEEYVTVEVAYHIKEEGNSKKIIIDDFKPFNIKGIKIVKSPTEFGELLAIEFSNKIMAVIEKVDSNNIAYAVRNIQKFNSSLLDEEFPEREKPVEPDEEDEIEDDTTAKAEKNN